MEVCGNGRSKLGVWEGIVVWLSGWVLIVKVFGGMANILVCFTVCLCVCVCLCLCSCVCVCVCVC